MNSIEVSKLFPSGTVIIAYKGKSIGGAKSMPQWKIEALINENNHLKYSDEILAELSVENSITIELDAVNPDVDSVYDFEDAPGMLTFLPLDFEDKVACCFPLTVLKEKSELQDNQSINWKFQILCDNNDIFMQKVKANS